MTIDVWLVNLEAAPARASLLSEDERERASRYRAPETSERFVITRTALREILARYAGLPPEDLRFSYPCACGRADCVPSSRKPRLDPETDLRFNVSHTKGLALIAVTRGRELGVDVERVQSGIAIEPLAKHVLGALPAGDRLDAFYRSWTRREAHAKARGDGLAPRGENGRWWVTDLTPAPGYLAALAVEGGECAVKTRRWP
jgi:4'-phosphopantetheinyl transferase